MKVLLFVISVGVACAEFRRMEIEVRDMDCASCVVSLRNALKRTRGVESAELNPERGTAVLTLLPDNKITLDRVRDAIKGAGFTPRTATVIVHGNAITEQGKWEFEVDGVNQKFLLGAKDEKLIGDLKKGGVMTIEAFAPVPANPRDQPSLEVKRIVP